MPLGLFVRAPLLLVGALGFLARPLAMQPGAVLFQRGARVFLTRAALIQPGTRPSKRLRRRREESEFEAQVQGGGKPPDCLERRGGAGEFEAGDAGLADAEALRQVGLGEAGLGAGPADHGEASVTEKPR